VEAFKNGTDLHKLIVSKVMNIPYEEIDNEMRQLGKPVNFGALYGMSAKTLVEYAKSKYNIEMSHETAKAFLKKYRETYPAVASWHDLTIRKIQKHKKIKTQTLLGRKALANRYTDALNYPIQGSGADLLKLTVALFFKKIKEENINAHIVNLIHDEIIVESSIEEKEKTKEVLRQSMEKAVKILIPQIPTPIEIQTGKSWAEIK